MLGDIESGTEHGAWLLDELDHINNNKRVADLVSWVDSKLLVPAEILSTPEAKLEFEVEVITASVRALANMLLLPFKDTLMSLSPWTRDEEDVTTSISRSISHGKRFSALEILSSDGQQHPLLVRCSREKSVKSTQRMGVKVAEAHANGVPFPAINNLGDALRASFCVETSADVHECWRCISGAFDVFRMKNKARKRIRYAFDRLWPIEFYALLPFLRARSSETPCRSFAAARRCEQCPRTCTSTASSSTLSATPR